MVGSGVLRRARSAGSMYLRGERSVEWYVAHGLRIGTGHSLERPFQLDRSHCWLISIGDDVTFGPEVYVLAHDASTKLTTGYTHVAPVRIGSRVFIGARSLILPGVTIGDDVIVGAGSVVVGDLPSASVAVGNPARPVRSLEEHARTVADEFAQRPRFGPEWTVWGGIDAGRRARMAAELDAGGGFVP